MMMSRGITGTLKRLSPKNASGTAAVMTAEPTSKTSTPRRRQSSTSAPATPTAHTIQ